MNYSIAVIPGDGIGPEVMDTALDILDALGDKFGHVFNYAVLKAGGAAIDSCGDPLPPETLETAKQCDALLMACVGGPQWDNLPGIRPEQALLGLRSGLGVFANLRPAVLYPQLQRACPLKDEILSNGSRGGKCGFDILIVRELIGGLYFGKRGRMDEPSSGHSPGSAFDTELYSWMEIERILRAGYDAAMGRRKKVCVVDKANILESSRFWREVNREVSKDYPEVETSYLYVDNAAMQLIRRPGTFDVIISSNLFGDILSDEAAALTGSIGLLPSASLGVRQARGYPKAIYEPVHGSAPDIAGQDAANPLAMILSAAMMLRYSFGLEKEAGAIEDAVNYVLDKGFRTKDIAGYGTDNSGHEKITGTREMGQAVLNALGVKNEK